jgi:hypothetical protein
MADSDGTLTQKERARLARREAYQKAKARRALDPKFQALKAAAKEQRRAEYQRQKERRRAAAVTQKQARKTAAESERTAHRAHSDAELLKLVTWVTKGSSADN